ncbi:MAG: hypothetical protein ABJP48_03465 [Erythrobacter sp.]
MDSQPLVLTDPNMLAEFVRQSELKAFFEKRFAAPADLGSVLFRDGAIIDGYKGTQFSIGGFWENVRSVVGGSHHYEILLLDLKPFQAVIPVQSLSKDNVEIVGEATFELQLNPDKPTNVLGLMRGVSRNETDDVAKDGSPVSKGRKALTVMDVVDRLEPQFRERIFGAVLARHNAEEIRGNRGLQDQIQADMMKEAERLLGDLGVMVRNATTNWATNEAERQAFERARIERDEKMKDFQLDLLKRQVSREADATSFVLTSQLDQTTLKHANEDKLRMMVLDSEVEFVDARENHARRQEFEALQHEAKIILSENETKTQIALGEIKDETVKAKAQKTLREAQFDLKKFENEFKRQEQKLESDFVRRESRADQDLAIDSAKSGAKVSGIKHDEERRQAEDWQRIALEKLEAMNRLEVDKESGLADIEIRKSEADTQGQVDKILAAGGLTGEQLSEVMPGLSKEAADVAIARANADGQNSADLLAMAREMMSESREHEHRMVETGMQGGVGMAAGLGGKEPASGGGSQATTVECANCKTVNSAKAKFCKACGHQLRN